MKSLSALFRQAPWIDGSSIRLVATIWVTRYVNSEGTSYVRTMSIANLQMEADAQASDGMPISDSEVIRASSIDRLPPQAEIEKRIRAFQARLDHLRSAGLIERYTGPVMFEPAAAGELFLQAMGSALVGVPRAVVDDLRWARVNDSNGGFAGRTGARTFSDFLSVTDDPSATEFHGQPLFGGYPVDDEGVIPHPTVIVDKGILKTLLHSRALLPGTTHSSASRRSNGPMPSNIFITSDKASPAADLRAELIRMAQQRGNEFGIVVRRISNPMQQNSLVRSRTIIMTGGNGAGNVNIEPVIEAVKVFADGHEEPVRNLNITSLTLGSFKDIVAVSDAAEVYTAQMRLQLRMPMMAMTRFPPGGPQVISVVIPALLFDDLTLQRPAGDVPNLPFTKHPFFDK